MAYTMNISLEEQQLIAKLAGVENDKTYVDEGDPDGSLWDTDQLWIERQGSLVNVMICSHGSAMTLFPGEIDRVINILQKAREESYKYSKAEIEYSRTIRYNNPPTAAFANNVTYSFNAGNDKYAVHLYVKDKQTFVDIAKDGKVVYTNNSPCIDCTQAAAYDYITLYLKQSFKEAPTNQNNQCVVTKSAETC